MCGTIVATVCSRSHGQSRRSRSVRRCNATSASARSSVCEHRPRGHRLVPRCAAQQAPQPLARRGHHRCVRGERRSRGCPATARSGSSSGRATGPAASITRQDASGIRSGSPGPRAISVAISRCLTWSWAPWTRSSSGPSTASASSAGRSRGRTSSASLLGLELRHDLRDVRRLARLQELSCRIWSLTPGERLRRARLHGVARRPDDEVARRACTCPASDGLRVGRVDLDQPGELIRLQAEGRLLEGVRQPVPLLKVKRLVRRRCRRSPPSATSAKLLPDASAACACSAAALVGEQHVVDRARVRARLVELLVRLVVVLRRPCR